MKERREQDKILDTLFADYAKGNLPYPVKVLVDAHLEMTDANHNWLGGLEMMAGADMASADPVAPSNRDAMLESIFASKMPEIPDLSSAYELSNISPTIADGAGEGTLYTPKSLRALIGMELENIEWRRKLPGFQQHKLDDIDGCEVNLFKIKAGSAVPTHTHHGSEFTLVLHGSFTDVRGRYAKGDISIADDSVDHKPIAGNESDCIGFAVTDAPLKLTGPIGRIFSSIVGG